MNIHEKIRKIVAQIPKGKVATYGDVAKAAGLTDARVVVWAIYGNQDPSVPCHRVVNKQGFLAKKFSLGGVEEHARRLAEDGLEIPSNFQIDLQTFGYRFNK